MDLQNVAKALEKNRYAVKVFDTKEEAIQYLDGLFDNLIVGFGDSETMEQMHLYETLSAHNTVIDPKQSVDNDDFLRIARDCLTTEVFLTSVNGMTEDGVLINLDGTGNRVAGSLFGHRKVYYIVGRNKIAPDIEQAIWRVRNIAAPKNAKRLQLRTPCAIKGDKCYNCASPDRICNGLLIQMKKMNDIDMEVVLINEDLGF
ncbi:MAG: lactate utilization protein [Peptococcaceae bacterium]|nr:lactate utilization protein [Peptococcaceae bacterium]